MPFVKHFDIYGNIVDIPEIMITLSDYGAKGDGVTDDSQAIINCLDAQDYVIFPSGTYKITKRIDFVNKKVMAIGNVTIYQTSLGKIVFDNCVVTGWTFKTVETTKAAVTTLNNGSTFYNCTFDVDFMGIEVGASNTSLVDCKFYGNGTAQFGVWADDQVRLIEKLTIDNCYFERFWLNAIFAYANQLIISNSRFVDNHLQVTPTGGGQIDVVKRDDDANYAQTIIDGCRITGGNSSTSGIETEAGSVIVTDCVITVPAAGIALQNTFNAVISNNYIYGCARGVHVTTECTFKLDGNRIINNTAFDLRCEVAMTKDCIISNNQFTTTKELSISFNNHVFNGKSYGNYPEFNNLNFIINSGQITFSRRNNRSAILKITNISRNLSAIYLLDGTAVYPINDHFGMLGADFTLTNDGSGNWTISMITNKYLYGNISSVL